MSKNIISALIVAAVLLLWLGSGMFGSDTAPEEHAALGVTAHSASPVRATELKRVRVRDILSEARMRYIVLRGRTQSKRTVDVKAEISGKVISRPVEEVPMSRGEIYCVSWQ